MIGLENVLCIVTLWVILHNVALRCNIPMVSSEDGHVPYAGQHQGRCPMGVLQLIIIVAQMRGLSAE